MLVFSSVGFLWFRTGFFQRKTRHWHAHSQRTMIVRRAVAWFVAADAGSVFSRTHPKHRRFPVQDTTTYVERLETDRHVCWNFHQKRTVGLHRYLAERVNISR